MTRPGDRNNISILFVDDKEDNFTVIKQRLERAFKALGCLAELVWEKDPDVAYDRITRDPEYRVIIADLLFHPPGQPDAPVTEHESRGLEILEHARRRSPKSVVVAITQGSPIRPELEQHAKDQNADLVLRRANLTDNSRYGGIKQLAKDIFDLLCERELLEVGPQLELTDEPGIQAAMHDIRHTTCRLLLTDLIQNLGAEPVSAALTYVTPGASGAHVFRAVVTLADTSTRRLLIKASRDHESLAREEFNARNLFGLYSSQLVVRYLRMDKSVRPRNGWSAIAMEFAEDARTIRDWLSDPRSATDVPSVFRQLFLDRGLAFGYQTSLPAPDGARPIDKLKLPLFRRVLVRTAVERLAPVLRHPDGANIAEADDVLRVVESFARNGRIGAAALEDLPGDLVLVMAHGDLHGANLLICGSPPRPLIIDFAAFDAHHWAIDPARLMVDAILRSFDSPVESYLWRRLGVWRQLMALASKLDNNAAYDSIESPGSQNAAVIAALRWIAEHWRQLLPPLAIPERRWEWHIALAEQLLRGTYQADLPPAKRTVALLAAYDQLKLAELVIPAPKPTF